jgi:hypothetical protein
LFDLPENPAAQYLHQEKACRQKGKKKGGEEKIQLLNICIRRKRAAKR